ncbi:TniQ family protein [Streptomyces sp. NPDC056387]|uniref:TniQ family protein n=1 Tax=Streptomyces sp. NPDC056387 TaxID=3345803 RepID=UPI0035DAFCEF
MTDATMGPGLRPFGLSLDPLEGESLAGFVLRLAHRLHISPHELARQTGLTEQDRLGRARASLSTLLSPDEVRLFALTTRLAPREVRAMTLEPLASRYPPAARSLDDVRAGRVYSMHTDGWLFATTARYCPHCLAGDGSAIQNAHGGPWKILWRLPVVFACPLHKVFLEHLCPHCHKPINFSSRTQLVPRPAATVVHPARCRSSTAQDTPTTRPGAPCGASLTHDPVQHHRPGPALLELQRKILGLLGPGRPKRQAQQYFTELILLAGLVVICWPRLQAVGTTHALATAVDRHLAIHEGVDSRPYRSSGAPIDALACAGLLQVTDRILSADDLREALSVLAPEENRTRSGIPPTRHLIWDNSFKKHRSGCSERFQLAADRIVPTFRRTGKGGFRLPSTGVGFRPEHIPACLPQALAERHLSFLSDITPKMRRRTASVFLVRRARGGGLNEAAQFLGISTADKMIGYTGLLNRHLRTSDTARDFEQALDAITAELLAGPVIDYQRRREALTSWTLAPENWQHMLTRLPVPASSRKPLSDDRRRLAVSAYIWTLVTEGEPDFAPCPPHIAPDPALRAIWTRERHNVFHWLRTTDHQPYYGALKPLLEDHAEQLAKAIDNHPQRRR